MPKLSLTQVREFLSLFVTNTSTSKELILHCAHRYFHCNVWLRLKCAWDKNQRKEKVRSQALFLQNGFRAAFKGHVKPFIHRINIFIINTHAKSSIYTTKPKSMLHKCKGQSGFQHHWTTQPRPLLSFSPSQGQVWHFQLFQENAFSISSCSACLPPPTVRGWLSGSNFKVWSQKRTGNFLKFLCFLELPAGSLQNPCSPRQRLADSGPIINSLQWTSMAADPFTISIPSCKPQDTREICHGEVKCLK